MCISCPADFVAPRVHTASPAASLFSVLCPDSEPIERDQRRSHLGLLYEDACDGFNVPSASGQQESGSLDSAAPWQSRSKTARLIQRAHSQGEMPVIVMPSSQERKRSRASSPIQGVAAASPETLFKPQSSSQSFSQPLTQTLFKAQSFSQSFSQPLKNRSISMVETSNKENSKLRRCISINSADLVEPEKKLQCVKDSVCTLEDCISIETAAALLEGDDMRRLFDRVVFVDCRYPYEYDGGHIRVPPSLADWIDVVHVPPHESQAALDLFFSGGGAHPLPPMRLGQDRVCIIFHCEFSERRGPDLWRKVRGEDRRRAFEKDHYPALYYPEMYVLKSGYKKFFETYPDLCEPQGYVPEADARFAADCTHFKHLHKQACPSFKSRLSKKKVAGRRDPFEVPRPMTAMGE